MTSSAIIYLISFYAAVGGIDPKVAIAVAQNESNLNPKAVGALGEIGLYQLRPEFVKHYSKKQLFNITTNIRVGIARLKEAQNTCIHHRKLEYLICFNMGAAAAKRIKYPSLFPYVVKVNKLVELNNKLAYNGNIL